MIIIPHTEIKELTKNCYINDGEEILTAHNPIDGEKAFALVLIEKCIGLLKEDNINDELIVQYLQGLISLTQDNVSYYTYYLNTYIKNKLAIDNALSKEKLSIQNKHALKELMGCNIAEYETKGEYQSCCYSAMEAFFLTAYCILVKNIDISIGHIDIIADLDDQLDSIKIYENENESENEDTPIFVEWHSTNKINSMYMLYKNEYAGLDNECILDLVAADVIEEDYYFKDERFSIAPSILVKQYCAIIEHEVNEIIQLLNLPDNPNKHLMWGNMKEYIKKNHIDLAATSYPLQDALDDLHVLRNKAAHGDVIDKEEYEIVSNYKNLGLFSGLSVEKLKLKNGKISPTIEDLKKYMGQ